MKISANFKTICRVYIAFNDTMNIVGNALFLLIITFERKSQRQ